MKYESCPDETSETIVRNLLSLFSCILVRQTRLSSLFYSLVIQPNTELSAVTTNQASCRNTFRVLGRLYNLILCGYPYI